MSDTSSPIPTFILTPDGLIPAPYRAFSLTDAINYEPEGVYTVARTFHGDHALLLGAHLDRLEQSAELSKIPLALDRDRLREALRKLLHEAGFPNAKFRITVPRSQPDHLYLALEPYHPVPEDIQRQGAHVITVPLARENPVVKTTVWMTIRRPTQQELPPDRYEGILVRPDGALLEGLSSNFYGVLDGVLHTAGEGVLEGITRRAIFAIAAPLLPLRTEPVYETDIPRLAEAMLTSSGRGVVPITTINGQPVGDGQVGPLVAEIRQRYDAWAESHMEPI